MFKSSSMKWIAGIAIFIVVLLAGGGVLIAAIAGGIGFFGYRYFIEKGGPSQNSESGRKPLFQF